MSAERIDVLAVMGAAHESAHESDLPGLAWRICQARAAVAELIETQKRLIEAFGERFPEGKGHATGTLFRDERQLPVILDAMAAIACAGGAVSNERIDVLTVMEHAASELPRLSSSEGLRDARAMVAELIDTGNRLLRETRIAELRNNKPGAVESFRSALTRIGGAA